MLQLKITLKSIFTNLTLSITFLVAIIVFSVIVYNVDFDMIAVYLLFGLFLIINIPTIVIFLNYWIEDRNKIVQIDTNHRTIKVTKGHLNHTYSFDEIKRVILVANSSCKSGESLRKAPWTDFFYYQIEFNDGERLILTSLLIKQKDFTLTVHHRRFLFIQTIDDFDYDSHIDAEIMVIKQMNQDEINKFKETFQDYSKSELQDILDNKTRYESAAVKAAKELLEKE